MGAHNVVVNLVAKGDQAANEFKKTAQAVDRLSGAQKDQSTGVQRATKFLTDNKVALGAVGVGAGLVAAGVQQAVSAYTSFASRVREVQRVSGASAKEASGLTYAFDKLGIGATKGAGAIFQLEKRIGTGKDGLDKFGISIARNVDGGVNLVGTLGNIADAYQRQTDQSQKAAILASAFGKQGKDLIPILAKGREGIKALFDEAARTNHLLDQGDIDRAKEFSLAVKEASNTFEGLKIKIGNALTPALTKITETGTALVQLGDKAHVFDLLSAGAKAWADTLTSPVTILKTWTDELGLTSNATDAYSVAQKQLNDDQRKYAALVASGNEKTAEGRALKQDIASLNGALGTSQQKLADAFKTSAQKAQDEANALNNLKSSLFDVERASHSTRDAQLNYADAQDALASAQDTLNKAKADGRQGDETDEQYARRIAGLQRDVERALYGVSDAHDAIAKAAVDALTSQQNFDAAAKDPKARAALIAQLQDARAKFGDATGAIGDAITKLQAYDQTNPKDKKVNVDTSDKQKVDDLRGSLDNIHDKYARISVQVDALLNNASGIAVQSINDALAKLFGHRALGGPVSANRPYIVGENGPEAFVPSGNGTIVPNHALNSSGGGDGGGITINISTPAVTAETGRILVEHIRAFERNSGSRWRQN